MLVSKDYAVAETLPILVTSIVTYIYDVIKARVAAEGHVWLYGPTIVWPVFMSVAPDEMGIHADVQGHASLGGYAVVVTRKPGLLPKTMYGSTVVSQLGSVLISVAHTGTKGHMDAGNLGHNFGTM